MDDVTKRLIDAALAYGAQYDNPDCRLSRSGDAVVAAARAYRKANRPLMERLADLPPGAVVRPSQGGPPRDVLLNHPASQRYAYLTQAGALDVGLYEYVGEIVSEGPTP